LGRRKCLEALVRDRPAAFDGEPVRAGGQTLLRTVECGEPIAKVFSQPLVELVQIEVCGKIPWLEPAGVVAVVLMPSTVERVLELAPLGGKQRPRTFGVHYSALSISAVRAGTRSASAFAVRRPAARAGATTLVRRASRAPCARATRSVVSPGCPSRRWSLVYD